MSLTSAMISRPLPLITHRILFSTKALSTKPTITPRIKFPARTAVKSKEYLHPQQERDLTPSASGSDDDDRMSTNSDSESELSELSELSDSDIDIPSSKKIPKPPGEPGRPRSGGYSIEVALASWGKEEFVKVNVGCCFYDNLLASVLKHQLTEIDQEACRSEIGQDEIIQQAER